MYLDAQQADEEEQQSLRKIGFGYEPAGEAEHQELLRLLEEEIASVGEEFAYAEKANEERAEIERDACLAPEGETWAMMLRQEAALDRSIDRKVRILMRLRNEAANLPVAPTGQDDGPRLRTMEEIFGNDTLSDTSQGVEAVEDLKTNDQCGNLTENKGSRLQNRKQSGNTIENKDNYAFKAGMSLKRKAIGGVQRC
jgi:hypothetical protein